MESNFRVRNPMRVDSEGLVKLENKTEMQIFEEFKVIGSLITSTEADISSMKTSQFSISSLFSTKREKMESNFRVNNPKRVDSEVLVK